MKETEEWQIAERPGYLGNKKDEQASLWDAKYGKGNWKIAWMLKNSEVLNFENIFYRIYVPGYVRYFRKHEKEAFWITENFSYGYDKDLIDKQTAFDPYALFDKPGVANQFHHVAFNLALEYFLNLPFVGKNPIQVRVGKPGTEVSNQPLGWEWNPGRILAVRMDLIPDVNLQGWWQPWTVEDCYQKAKALLVKPY